MFGAFTEFRWAAVNFVGVTLQKYRRDAKAGCGIHAGSDGPCSEVKMMLFSRTFIRKRVISMATTASVAATSFAMAQGSTSPHHVLDRIQYAAASHEYAEEQAFLSRNAAAMRKMMAGMTIKPSGDIDRDFVAMMVPHHQGAVDMAKTELEYGHNTRLRRLARQIV